MQQKKAAKEMDDCKYFDSDDASCKIGVNGGYCIVCWEDKPCDKKEGSTNESTKSDD